MPMIRGTIVLIFLTLQSESILNTDKSNLQNILLSSRGVLSFLNERYYRINVDGIIGVRIYQGVLRAIVAKKGMEIPVDLLNELKSQDSLSNSLSFKAIKIIKEKTPIYYTKLWPMVSENFWTAPLPPRNINPQYMYKDVSLILELDELTGDDCYALLMGTSGKEACSISKRCLDIMTKENYSDYSLTHQVFYFLIAIKANCIQELEREIELKHQTTENILDRLCTNVWKETTAIGQNLHIEVYSDIFMEQIGFCGYAGYGKYFNESKWLNTILNWQSLSGCYGVLENENFNMKNLDPNRYGTYRRKRAESLLSSDGCMAHKSGVALTALSTYLWNEITV